MAYEIKRFPYDGTVDADGHVLEPPDLWENYLEERYRPRALRIGVDDDSGDHLNARLERRLRAGTYRVVVRPYHRSLGPFILVRER